MASPGNLAALGNSGTQVIRTDNTAHNRQLKISRVLQETSNVERPILNYNS